MRLSVIIPAHNEETRLPVTVIKIDAYLKNQGYFYELLVVDDGSTDGTGQAVQKMTQEIKNLKVIGYQKNKGKGYAVRLGMFEAKGEYCLFLDADNSVSIEQIERFFPELENKTDVAIASRDAQGAVLDPPQGWWRRVVMAGVYKGMRKTLLNLRDIEDTQCGFKCFKKEAAKKIFSRCRINGLSFDVEVLLIARKMGFIIKEIPVYWSNSSLSRVTFRLIIGAALDLLRIKMNSVLYFKKRPY